MKNSDAKVNGVHDVDLTEHLQFLMNIYNDDPSIDEYSLPVVFKQGIVSLTTLILKLYQDAFFSMKTTTAIRLLLSIVAVTNVIIIVLLVVLAMK